MGERRVDEEGGVDIDLHVTNPTTGKVCYYKERTACKGELIHDHKTKGTSEVFFHPKLMAENQWWSVGYNYYNGTELVDVEGFVYHPDGTKVIPTRRLGPEHHLSGESSNTVLQFKVDTEGKVRFREPQ